MHRIRVPCVQGFADHDNEKASPRIMGTVICAGRSGRSRMVSFVTSALGPWLAIDSSVSTCESRLLPCVPDRVSFMVYPLSGDLMQNTDNTDIVLA